MKKARIAIIGGTEFRDGEWTGAVAIAIETAAQWNVEVSLRSVAANAELAHRLRTELESLGVAASITVREGAVGSVLSDGHTDVEMGDPLAIPYLFDHDVIVLASRDRRLRRFLADLPVHTRPDVRLIACLHFDRGPVVGERPEDLLRFDTLIGGEDDFHGLNKSLGDDSSIHPLGVIHQRMVGGNLRAAIAWDERGSFSLAEPHQPILSVAPAATALQPDSTSWPAFVSAVAVGIARRDPWDRVGRNACEAYAGRPYT